MKNVTITLDEDVAAWARVEAAKAGKSLSRYLADILSEQKRMAGNQRVAAFMQWLEGPGWASAGGVLPTREELYAEREDELLRRYERSRLRGGPKRSEKAAAGADVAPRARRS